MAEPRNRGNQPRGRSIDWQRAAQMLAQGQTIDETAEAAGCSPDDLTQHQRRGTTFGATSETFPTPDQGADAGNQGGLGTHRDLSDLGDVLRDAISREVRAGNIRVVLWLADRLKIVGASDQSTSKDDLQALLGEFGATECHEFESLRD